MWWNRIKLFTDRTDAIANSKCCAAYCVNRYLRSDIMMQTTNILKTRYDKKKKKWCKCEKGPQKNNLISTIRPCYLTINFYFTIFFFCLDFFSYKNIYWTYNRKLICYHRRWLCKEKQSRNGERNKYKNTYRLHPTRFLQNWSDFSLFLIVALLVFVLRF